MLALKHSFLYHARCVYCVPPDWRRLPIFCDAFVVSRELPTSHIFNKSNLPPLPTSRQCPAHPFWVPTNMQIRNMITKRHNIACHVIFKSFSKTGSLGSSVVSIYLSSNEQMTIQNFQIPETAESRIVPKWLLPPRSPDKDRITSSHPYLWIARETESYKA